MPNSISKQLKSNFLEHSLKPRLKPIKTEIYLTVFFPDLQSLRFCSKRVWSILVEICQLKTFELNKLEKILWKNFGAKSRKKSK